MRKIYKTIVTFTLLLINITLLIERRKRNIGTALMEIAEECYHRRVTNLSGRHEPRFGTSNGTLSTWMSRFLFSSRLTEPISSSVDFSPSLGNISVESRVEENELKGEENRRS